MLVLREERHEDLLVSVGRRQVDGRGAARGHPSPLLLLLSKLCQVAVLAVVEQVDESFGVTGGGRVVHGAQAAVVPQGGVGLVLCEIHTRRCVFRSNPSLLPCVFHSRVPSGDSRRSCPPRPPSWCRCSASAPCNRLGRSDSRSILDS